MNSKNIILVMAIILLVAGTFMFLMAHQAHPKLESKLAMASADNLTEGDNITVKLTDADGNPIANQNINISVISNSGGSLLKSLTTNDSGEASIETNESTLGGCAIIVRYGGNDEFAGCNMTDRVVINEKVVVVVSNSTFYEDNYTYDYGYDDYSNYYWDDVVTTEEYIT